MAGDGDVAGQAGQHGGASLIQCRRIAQQVDEAASIQIGSNQVATGAGGADVQVTAQHILRDGDATGLTAELGSCSIRCLDLEGSSLASGAIGGVGEIIDGTQEGEPAALLCAKADFRGAHVDSLLGYVEFIEHGSPGLVD